MTPDPSAAKPWPYTKLMYIIVIVCWVIYVVASLTQPSAAVAHYNLSTASLIFLRSAIFIPVLVIWILAVRGTTMIKSYTTAVESGTEAPALKRISDGLIWTIIYLISASLVGSIVPHFVGTPYLTTSLLIRNHISPIAALIAFILIYRGSQGLKLVAIFNTWSRETVIALGIFALFSATFVFEFATVSTSATDSSGIPLSTLPHEVLLFTAVMPFILAWFLGILAMVNIRKYAVTVSGILYRQALKNLAYGIGVIIAFTMLHQLLIFSSRFLVSLKLVTVLLIIYLLLGVYALGFILVRRGARNLMRIEALQ